MRDLAAHRRVALLLARGTHPESVFTLAGHVLHSPRPHPRSM
jgi:hypothetical protein